MLEVYRRLSKRHNITVITSTATRRSKPVVEEIEGIKVVRLKTVQTNLPRMPMPFLVFDGLKKALVRENSDIYHINNRYQYFGDTVSIVKRRLHKKIALTIHNAKPQNINLTTDELGRFYDWLWGKKLMGKADLITAVSEYTANTTVPRRYRKKTHVVYNGVDFNNFRKIKKSSENVEKVIDTFDLHGTGVITNGRLVPQKGQIYLLQAFSELVNVEKEDLHLMIIGNGPLKSYLTRYAIREGIRKRVNFTYGIDDVALPYYYNACDVFAFPSLYEPAGLAVCEAMACELPSVVSDVGGIPEMVGDCGFYTIPKDYYSIKEKLNYVLENRKATASIVRKGRQRMVRHHNWDKISKEYERLFSGIARA